MALKVDAFFPLKKKKKICVHFTNIIKWFNNSIMVHINRKFFKILL